MPNPGADPKSRLKELDLGFGGDTWRRAAAAATGGVKVWESLAILEYVAEAHPSLWPAARPERAAARSLAAEMHSGFPEIREAMSCNLRRRYGPRKWSPAIEKEKSRALQLFEAARAAATARRPEESPPDEGFLFGAFCIADAMFAPLISRFETYAVDTEPERYPLANEYMRAVRTSPGWGSVYAAAEACPLLVPQYENVYPEVLNPEIPVDK